MSSLLNKIKNKSGNLELHELLEDKLSGSELNSYLLHLFQRRADQLSPADLLNQLEDNRFVKVSEVHPLAYKALEMECLEHAEKSGYTPVILSPLAPLGTCSVVGEVHQNNVVSATRGTEVVSDATNMLALLLADEQKSVSDKNKYIRYATTHRHVRGQAFNNPAFSAHFGVFCLVSGGYDRGNYSFELSQLIEHIQLHHALLSQKFGAEQLHVQFFLKDQQHPFHPFLTHALSCLPFAYEVIHEPKSGDYYQLIQFKIFLKRQEMKIDLADGGLVNWTQKLLSNKKHRLFISGCGLELIHKFLSNEIH